MTRLLRIACASLLALAGTLAAEEADCPGCGGRVKFDDSPTGAFTKMKVALLESDVDLARACISGLGELKDPAELGNRLRDGWSRFLLAKVASEKVDGDHATLDLEMAKGKEERIEAVREGGAWKVQFETPIAANERRAATVVKQLFASNGAWRQDNSDPEGPRYYWTLDVAGFYYGLDPGGRLLKYVDVAIANADRTGLGAYAKEPPRPYAGYWLRVLTKDEKGTPYAQDVEGKGQKRTNRSSYGFCAYPAEYGVTGTKTFIVNEKGVGYEKDLGPDAKDGVDAWPADDPTEKGWKASD